MLLPVGQQEVRKIMRKKRNQWREGERGREGEGRERREGEGGERRGREEGERGGGGGGGEGGGGEGGGGEENKQWPENNKRNIEYLEEGGRGRIRPQILSHFPFVTEIYPLMIQNKINK